MKVWYKNHRYEKGGLVNETREILEKFGKRGYSNVEVFGWFDDPYENRHLPTAFYQLVDYGSRDTILVYEDGNYISDEKEIEKWEESQQTE